MSNVEVLNYIAPQQRQPFWQFVGECGLDSKGNHLTASREEYVFWLQLGIAFLRHTYGEPPSGWVLDILWANAPHGGGQFTIIAVGFDQEEQSADVFTYAEQLDKDLQIFNKAVDWRAIASHPISDAKA